MQFRRACVETKKWQRRQQTRSATVGRPTPTDLRSPSRLMIMGSCLCFHYSFCETRMMYVNSCFRKVSSRHGTLPMMGEYASWLGVLCTSSHHVYTNPKPTGPMTPAHYDHGSTYAHNGIGRPCVGLECSAINRSRPAKDLGWDTC
jgi:hypothetical protein